MRPLLAFAVAVVLLARAVERGIARGFVAALTAAEDAPVI